MHLYTHEKPAPQLQDPASIALWVRDTGSRGLHYWAVHLLKYNRDTVLEFRDPSSHFLFIGKASHASSSNICLMLNLLICSYRQALLMRFGLVSIISSFKTTVSDL